MAFTFDGVNKLIICDAGTVAFSAGEVYSRWKDWIQSSADNAKYETAFGSSVGGNSLGNNVNLGAYYFLQNGWKIRPQEANHTLEITGNLFPIPDTADLFQPTVGSFNVQIAVRTSSLTQIALTPAAESSADIADAVWAEDISSAASSTAGDTLNKAKSNAAAAVALSA